MKQSKRIVLATILFFLIFQLILIIVAEEHDCTHDSSCMVCNFITQTENQMKLLIIPPIKLLLSFCFMLSVFIWKINKQIDNFSYTLIDLKVRINN